MTTTPVLQRVLMSQLACDKLAKSNKHMAEVVGCLHKVTQLKPDEIRTLPLLRGKNLTVQKVMKRWGDAVLYWPIRSIMSMMVDTVLPVAKWFAPVGGILETEMPSWVEVPTWLGGQGPVRQFFSDVHQGHIVILHVSQLPTGIILLHDMCVLQVV